jgi:predicted aspartyl protease
MFGNGVEFDAILDTGFTGFICMPLLKALPLGLVLYGTTSVELADGSQSMKLTAKGTATCYGDSKVGVIILEPSANDILIGMDFLRIFQKALFVTQRTILLVNEESSPDVEKKPAPEETGKPLELEAEDEEKPKIREVPN